MHTTIEYATRPGILAEDSLVAVSVGGILTVQHVRACGPALEALAFVRALRGAYEAGITKGKFIVSSTLSELLQRDLSGEKVVGSSQALINVHRLMSLIECDMVVGEPSDHLVELLAEQPFSTSDWTMSEEDEAWARANKATVVYTDGSCSSGMVGAWAWYVNEDSYQSGFISYPSSSLTAERRAIAEAIKANPGPLLVLGDCESVMLSFDTAIAVMQIEDPLTEALKGAHVRFTHVKGHATCTGNRKADSLARRALGARLDYMDENPALDALFLQAVREVSTLLAERDSTIKRKRLRRRIV